MLKHIKKQFCIHIVTMSMYIYILIVTICMQNCFLDFFLTVFYVINRMTNVFQK